MSEQAGDSIYDALEGAAKLLRANGFSFALKGGLAASIWGEPRVTLDIDLSAFIEFGQEGDLLDCLLARHTYLGDMSLDAAIRLQFARLVAENGVGIDVAFAYADEYYTAARKRLRKVEIRPGLTVEVFSPEDILIQKCLAGRESKDMRDIPAIILRQFKSLDVPYIRRYLGTFREFVDTHDPLELFDSQYRKVKTIMTLRGVKDKG